MIKYLSLFSGIGAPEQALKNIGISYDLVGFSEIDKYAVQSYCAIHDADAMLDDLGDITKIDFDELPKDIDLITHGSPCQDFSVAGKGGGGDEGSGTRSSLMWNTVEICRHCKPKYVLWENVKNVLSKKHKHNFDKYISEMESIGYDNYYKILNAKDFGIPQNRERVFVVSIRKDLNKDFEFPIGYDNGLRLKDFLENEVSENYYINTEKAEKLIQEFKSTNKKTLNINPSGKGMNGVVRNDEIASAITTNKGEGQKIVIPRITPDRLEKRQNGRRFKEDGEPMFTITAQDRHGILQVGKIDIKGNDQIKRVYSPEGVSPTLSTMQGGNRQPKVLIKNNTKQGYLEAYPGDGIDLENPASKTRRGRVQKQSIQTINTTDHKGVLTRDLRIRKLTPLECWRLMGFKDKQFRKAEAVCSNSQLYKQAGNSIVVNVLEEIFKELFKEELRQC